MPSNSSIPDIVDVSKIDAHLFPDSKCTVHVKYVPGSATGPRKIRKEEVWQRGKDLGEGGFGIVWLERCMQGDPKGEVRAVKEIKKLKSSDCFRELEAVALFSHTKYEQHFVKSFGWYEGHDNIYIAMEYLPKGDLHKYLDSPLPEQEARQIVGQVLEGLRSMHNKGFAHRDLKPANILVMCEGPQWWVKIADFGISKRATEVTALRTETGTPAFAAPEVLGHCRPGEKANDSYTSAVDIWSLGVIAFFTLTGVTLFKSPRVLGRYVSGDFDFPVDILKSRRISRRACEFIQSSMTREAKGRPDAKSCLKHPWLRYPIEVPEYENELLSSASSATLLNTQDSEASANWGTTCEQNAREKNEETKEIIIEQVTFTTITIKAANASAKESLWDRAPQWTVLRTLEGHAGRVLGYEAGVNSVAYSPDGTRIASGGGDYTVKLWDAATGAALSTLIGHTNRVEVLQFSPDGRLVVSAAVDDIIKLWDVTNSECTAYLTIEPPPICFPSRKTVNFTPDGKQIFSGTRDGPVLFWDSLTGASCGILNGLSKQLSDIRFSPDGKQIITTSKDGIVRLWDLATRNALNTIEACANNATLSLDGRYILTTSGTECRIWDKTSSALRYVYKSHLWTLNDFMFSPDGQQMLFMGWNKNAIFWDSDTGAICARLVNEEKEFRELAISPDGTQIATTSGLDPVIKIWHSGKKPVNFKDKTPDNWQTKLRRTQTVPPSYYPFPHLLKHVK